MKTGDICKAAGWKTSTKPEGVCWRCKEIAVRNQICPLRVGEKKILRLWCGLSLVFYQISLESPPPLSSAHRCSGCLCPKATPHVQNMDVQYQWSVSDGYRMLKSQLGHLVVPQTRMGQERLPQSSRSCTIFSGWHNIKHSVTGQVGCICLERRAVHVCVGLLTFTAHLALKSSFY